jgi:hypothetical protein
MKHTNTEMNQESRKAGRERAFAAFLLSCVPDKSPSSFQLRCIRGSKHAAVKGGA